MTWSFPPDASGRPLSEQVEAKSGQHIASCYQCGKCTAGCPNAFSMDYPPNQIMRAIQLGMRDAVLQSRAIWLCVACETCSTRCPQGLDVAAVMDTLRQIAYASKIESPEREVPIFHRIFLGSVRQHGRLFEATLMGLYNVLSGNYTKDLGLAPLMLGKGKLGLLPPIVGDMSSVRKMFDRAKELEADTE